MKLNKIFLIGWRILFAGIFILSFGQTSPVHAANVDLYIIYFNHNGGNFVPLETGRTYTIRVHNLGDLNSSGLVTVTDTLPNQLTATGISGSGWDCILGTLTCTRSDVLVIGEAYPDITVTVTVDVSAPSSVINTATVSGGADSLPDNNTVTTTTPVNAKPDLIITGYELVDINGDPLLASPNPDEEFGIRVIVQNRGGESTLGVFYRSVYVNRNPMNPALFSINHPGDEGCLYNLNTNENDTGDYFKENFFGGLPAGVTDTTTIVTITGGLPAGSYQLYLYADPTCIANNESIENNNSYGPISFSMGELPLASPWTGGIIIESDRNVVAVGRPHIGNQVMAYDGFVGGSLSMYLPMLFKDAFGGSYDAAWYVQNVNAVNTANIEIKFYDTAGTLSCTKNDTIAPLSLKGYWMPAETCLPSGWVGGVVITSTENIVAVGRPHIGSEITTYNGFAGGSLSMYLPMLFKDAFGGGYDAALYVQNVDAVNTANIQMKFYDTAGVLSCTKNDTIAPLSSKGYWMPAETCLPTGWVGGVVVTSNRNIVAVGRPHIDTQITTYSGFGGGGTSMNVPMLFKDAFGGSYDAALYVQNVDAVNTANIEIKFYDTAGTLSCTKNDTIAPLSSKGYWMPAETCLPSGWAGGVVVTSNRNIIAVGRPHLGSEIMTYDGFMQGSLSNFVPMLFKDAFGGSYDAAFYIQNLDQVNTANVTIKFYDTTGTLTCTRTDTLSPLSSSGYWTPTLTCEY